MPSTPEPGSVAERIVWTRSRMGLLAGIAEEFSRTRPFAGLRIGVCIHLEPKTVVLLETLRAGGAEVVATGNFGTTLDEAVAVLREEGIDAVGSANLSPDEHLANKAYVVGSEPDLVLDNGAELASLIEPLGRRGIRGGTEETTTGALRLRGGEVACLYPMIVINDSPLKLIFENEIGVGQTMLESLMRETNTTPAGKSVVVVGYGWCGRGIAKFFRDFGGLVTVVDTDPVRALDAAVRGYEVRTLLDAATTADMLITVTGHPGVITAEALFRMPDGAIVANAGHFGTEIDIDGLEAVASEAQDVLTESRSYRVPNGTVTVLAGGNMLNLLCGSGNPLETMDVGFAMQALSLAWMVTHAGGLDNVAIPVPTEINNDVALRLLKILRGYTP